jgi:hypothetical protein
MLWKITAAALKLRHLHLVSLDSMWSNLLTATHGNKHLLGAHC